MGSAPVAALHVELHLLIARMDPLKYIFEKPSLTGRISRWQMLLAEFYIIFVTQKAVKGQAIADQLADNPLPDYEPMQTYFPDEEVMFATEEEPEEYPDWRLFFDGAANVFGNGVGAVLVSPQGTQLPISVKLFLALTTSRSMRRASWVCKQPWIWV